MSKFVNIIITNPNYGLEPFWLDKPFKHVSEVFPNWFTAEIILEDYVNKLSDWTVSNEIREVFIGPTQPLVRDLFYGELIPLWKTFPPEDQPMFLEIYHKCVTDFTPNLETMLGQKLTQSSLYRVESMIKSHYFSIKSMGSPEFKDWLRYNLGLYSNLNGLNFINFEITHE